MPGHAGQHFPGQIAIRLRHARNHVVEYERNRLLRLPSQPKAGETDRRAAIGDRYVCDGEIGNRVALPIMRRQLDGDLGDASGPRAGGKQASLRCLLERQQEWNRGERQPRHKSQLGSQTRHSTTPWALARFTGLLRPRRVRPRRYSRLNVTVLVTFCPPWLRMTVISYSPAPSLVELSVVR